MRHLLARLGSALSELRRRRIFQVVIVYAIVAWLAVQITAIAVPALLLPSWVLTLVFLLALLGFPIAAILTWAYDLTPGGLERTRSGPTVSEAGSRLGGDPTASEEARLTGDPTDAAAALRRLGRRGWADSAEKAEPPDGAAALASDAAPPEAASDAVAAARLILVTFVVLTMGLVGWAGWGLWLRPAPAEVRAADPVEALDPTRVAVLYFDDHSEGEDLGYLAAGLTEALIHELAQVSALDVVSRFGVKPFRDRDPESDTEQESPAQVLRAGSVVEGSVQRSGDRLRVTVQLVDGTTGTHLESATLERPWGELFELQDDLVVQVSDLLRHRLGTELRLRGRRAQTESIEAWTMVRKAEELWDEADILAREKETEAAERLLDRADSLLARAEELDRSWLEPILVRGWIAMSRAGLAGPTPDVQDPVWYERGLERAELALRRSPQNPRGLELRGILRYRLSQVPDAPGAASLRRLAEQDLEAAVSAEPSRARAWAELSDLLRLENRGAEAKRAAERALEADAFLSDADLIIRRLFETSLDLGNFAEANRWCEHGRQRFPRERAFVGCSLFLLALDGGPDPDVDRAWGLLEESLELSPPAGVDFNRRFGGLWVAATIARAAREAIEEEQGEVAGPDGPARLSRILADSARAVASRAREGLSGETPAHLDYYEANVRLLLGEREEALRLLESFLEAVPARRSYLATDWMFRPLWEDPAFRALVTDS